jgi:hypothetical protein
MPVAVAIKFQTHCQDPTRLPLYPPAQWTDKYLHFTTQSVRE